MDVEKVVGATRLELAASWSRTRRATKLRYAPIVHSCKLYTSRGGLSIITPQNTSLRLCPKTVRRIHERRIFQKNGEYKPSKFCEKEVSHEKK